MLLLYLQHSRNLGTTFSPSSVHEPVPERSKDNLGDRGEPLAADVAGELGEAEVDKLPRWRRERVRGRGSWNIIQSI